MKLYRTASQHSLSSYRARYYDPSSGRFLSEDPIGFAGGDKNLYRYVLNNPVNLVDSSGLAFSHPSDYAGYGGAGGEGIAIGTIALVEAFSKPKQEFVPGDYDTAQDDFLDQLINGGGKDYSDKGDGVFVGDLPNGDKLIVRPKSSNGSPTIETQDPNGRSKSKKRFCDGK
ncbi:MAG: RHS repeat-associated core domain-containing protein [Bacteriovoracaceae bacterium]|nr:RHS repeat-associated core domain-containing protein [Bacteriovoracaceae bacterium]